MNRNRWTPQTATPWLLRALPSPHRRTQTQSGEIILAGEPPAVVVRINGGALRFGVFAAMQWRDLTALADEPIASLTWKQWPEDPVVCEAVARSLSDAAQALHTARVAARTKPA